MRDADAGGGSPRPRSGRCRREGRDRSAAPAASDARSRRGCAAAGDEVVIGSRDAERARRAAAELGARGRRERGRRRAASTSSCSPSRPRPRSTRPRALADAIGETPLLCVASELHFGDGRRHARARAGARSPSRSRRSSAAPVAAGLALARRGAPRRRARPTRTRSSAATTPARRSSRSSSRAQLVAGRAIDAGPLANARALEGMTAVIVNVNQRYKAHAGIRLTGLP